MNLLIVGSDARARARLRAYLEVLVPRCRILEASNGTLALQACASERPELVLVDLGLPDSDGIALTARLRALSPCPAVIVLSALEDHDCVARARAAGAYTCLVTERLATDLTPAIARALGIPRKAGDQ